MGAGGVNEQKRKMGGKRKRWLAWGQVESKNENARREEREREGCKFWMGEGTMEV